MIEQGTRGDADKIIWKEPSYSLTAAGGLKKTITGTGNHADCQALIDGFGTDGWDVEVVPIDGTPRSTITANIVSTITAIGSTTGVGSGGDPNVSIQISWEVDCQVGAVDVADSVAYRTYLKTFTTLSAKVTRDQAIRKAAQGLQQFNTTDWTALPNDVERGFAWDIAIGAVVYEANPVLRRTAVYPRTSTNRFPDWDNAGKVFTTAQLDVYTDAPTAILGTIPTDATWLMIPDTLVYEADGRVVITAHWLSGIFPTHRHVPKTP